MKYVAPLLLVVVAATNLNAQTGDAGNSLQSLVEAERAFASTSVTEGMRAAFLANLAEDAIVFAPTPTGGRALWEARPNSEAVLSWYPEFADISVGGDMGYTTGPWEVRVAPGTEPVAWGHYVSVWRRDSIGTWKVAIDAGITYGRPEREADANPSFADTENPGESPRVNLETEQAALLETDRAFSEASEASGVASALASYALPNARIYRDSLLPILGRDGIDRAIAAGHASRVSWEPTAAVISKVGDLGFTYGIAEAHPSDTARPAWRSASYLRIWKKEPGETWRAVLDLLAPIPPN